MFSFFSSCKKQAEENPEVSNRIKTYKEDVVSGADHEIATFNFDYDSEGRVKSIVMAENSANKFIYEYPSTNKFTLDLYVSGEAPAHFDFFINSQSLVDSFFESDTDGDATAAKYIYNAAKKLTVQREYSYYPGMGAVLDGYTTYTYNAGGNMIYETDGSYEKTIEYYTEYENNLGSLFPLFSVLSKNLPSETTYTEGDDALVLTHTYTFDDKKRITSEKIVSADGVATRTYTYY